MCLRLPYDFPVSAHAACELSHSTLHVGFESSKNLLSTKSFVISALPVLLQPDNITPPTRTPWGGTRLGSELKPGLAGRVVGESWELSVEPDFPTHVESAGGPSLDTVIRSDPEGWLGREHELGRSSTALLVKLVDTSAALSVQIHPADDAPFLSSSESGKPESWYVLERDPGAGLYVGLAESATKEELEHTVRSSGAVDRLLQFVPVEPGDFFLIEAGTPHAIGAGITLVEPQRVLPGRRGVTYRYWDWKPPLRFQRPACRVR